MGYSATLFRYFLLFNKHLFLWKLPMTTGFKPRFAIVRSECSTNCTTFFFNNYDIFFWCQGCTINRNVPCVDWHLAWSLLAGFSWRTPRAKYGNPYLCITMYAISLRSLLDKWWYKSTCLLHQPKNLVVSKSSFNNSLI